MTKIIRNKTNDDLQNLQKTVAEKIQLQRQLTNNSTDEAKKKLHRVNIFIGAFQRLINISESKSGGQSVAQTSV